MQVKKQQLESDMEKLTDSRLRKEYIKAVYCHPEYLMLNARLEESQARIKMTGMQMTPPLWQKAKKN